MVETGRGIEPTAWGKDTARGTPSACADRGSNRASGQVCGALHSGRGLELPCDLGIAAVGQGRDISLRAWGKGTVPVGGRGRAFDAGSKGRRGPAPAPEPAWAYEARRDWDTRPAGAVLGRGTGRKAWGRDIASGTERALPTWLVPVPVPALHMGIVPGRA